MENREMVVQPIINAGDLGYNSALHISTLNECRYVSGGKKAESNKKFSPK